MNVNHQELHQNFNQKVKENVQNGPAVSIIPQKKSTFISKVQRFHSSTSMTPGPGTYQSQILQKHTLDFRASKQKEDAFALPKQHAWINGSGRMSYVPSNSALSRIGPGDYGQKSSQYQFKNSSWSKCQRFNQQKVPLSRLGPGSYDSNKMKISQTVAPASVFKSKSPRTFIQQMVQKSKKQAKAKKNPQVEQRNKEEVVKFEQTQYLVRKKINNNSPMFLSKSQRPDNFVIEHTPNLLGPGTYDSKVLSNTLHQKLISPRSSMHYAAALLNSDKNDSKSSQLGPGCYQIQAGFNSQRFRKKKQPLGIIPKSQRFEKSLPLKKSCPGPGEYMQNRFTMIEEDDVRFKSKGSFARRPQKNHNFGIAPRQTNRNHNNIPFGEYNVKNYDIEHKLQRQKEQYQKLRMMEVTLPAFNTKKKQ